MTAAEIVKALGGRNGTARCPAHNDRTPSLSVSDGPGGKLLVHCHAGCNQEAVWAALKWRGLIQQAVRGAGMAVARGKLAKSPNGDASDRRAEALAIWEASRPALYSPAQDCLACRGIVIQPPPTIRYHEHKHMLVAAIQAQDGTLMAVQRIYLTTDSRGTWRTGKFSLGPVSGGAIRLTPAAESLQITESVEDGLALLQMTGKPTWAVTGTSFMPLLELPSEVRQVILAPDNDVAGLKAIVKTTEALSNRVIRVKVREQLPPPDKDWCDVLESFGERAAIREYDGHEDREKAEAQSWVEAFLDDS